MKSKSMTTTYKEHRHVRKWVKKYLKSNPHISLEDMARRYYIDKSGHRHNLYITDGWRTQAKKMLQEARLQSKEISIEVPPVVINEDNSAEAQPVANPAKGLKFTFHQSRGKNLANGTLTAALDGKVIVIDSFNIAKSSLRRAFITSIWSTGKLPTCSYLDKDLIQFLLDMAADVVNWGKPAPAQEVKQSGKILKGLPFEKMLANHNASKKVGPCHIEKMFQRRAS